MQRFDLSKTIFWVLVTVSVLGGAFLLGVHSGAKRNVAYRLVTRVKNAVAQSLALLADEAPTLTKTRPTWFLQPARYQGDGVTINRTTDDDLILLSGFFDDSNEVRLIERDGTIVARWPVSYSALFPDTSHLEEPPATDWNVDLHGALIGPMGSVVANLDYVGLFKLDRCGRVEWTLARQTHHSVEAAEGGGYWVPSRRYVTEEATPAYPPFPAPYYDDTVMKVSEDGRILLEKSAAAMFYANDLSAVLTATGSSIKRNWDWDHEIMHLNKVGELKSAIAGAFPAFSAGDLLLSIRELNMLLVVDPDSEKIKWWRIGPWLRQHDPEFTDKGTITVFNNNAYRSAFPAHGEVSLPSIPRVSNIIEVSPKTGEHRVVYGGRDGQRMLSVIRGKQQPTVRGGILVTEFEGGRVFEIDADGAMVWEYVNRYDDDSVAEITEARVYSRAYFDVADWSCPETAQ